MDHLRAFYTLNHTLLLVKCKAYDRQPAPLKLMQNYLIGRYQRIRVNNGYNSWSEIIERVPQRSTLGPLLCNIFEIVYSYTQKKCFFK